MDLLARPALYPVAAAGLALLVYLLACTWCFNAATASKIETYNHIMSVVKRSCATYVAFNPAATCEEVVGEDGKPLVIYRGSSPGFRYAVGVDPFPQAH